MILGEDFGARRGGLPGGLLGCASGVSFRDRFSG